MGQHGFIFIFVILTLVVYKVECLTESRDAYCERLQKEQVVCFDERTLGACVKFENYWIGVQTAVCNATYNLCCDASANGCRLNGNNCLTTPNIECIDGETKEHPSNCRFFYACLGGVWNLKNCREGTIYIAGACLAGNC